MEDQALRASNIEVVKEGHFFPNETTVPVERSVLSHDNADIFYDKATDKLILVPEEHPVQGHLFEKDKVDARLDEIANSMRGFGVKDYESGSDLNEKLSRSVNRTKEELHDLASRTSAKIEETAVKVRESATEAKEQVQEKGLSGLADMGKGPAAERPGVGLTDKFNQMSKNFTDKVANLAEGLLGFGSKPKYEEPEIQTHQVAESTAIRVDDQPSDLGAQLENKKPIIRVEAEPIQTHQVAQATAIRLDDQPSDFGAELEVKQPVIKIEAEPIQAHQVAEATAIRLDDQPSDFGARLEDKDLSAKLEAKDLSARLEEKFSEIGTAISDKAHEIGEAISEKTEQLKTGISEKFSDIAHGKFESNVTGITDLGQGAVITENQESYLTAMADDNYMTSHRVNATDLL